MTGYLFVMLPGYASVMRAGIALVVLVAIVFARSRRGPSRLRLAMLALFCGPAFGVFVAWLNTERAGIPGDIYERCGGIGAIAGIIAAFAFWVAAPSSGRASKQPQPTLPVYDRELNGGP